MRTSIEWLPRSTKSPLKMYGLNISGRPFLIGKEHDGGENRATHFMHSI